MGSFAEHGITVVVLRIEAAKRWRVTSGLLRTSLRRTHTADDLMPTGLRKSGGALGTQRLARARLNNCSSPTLCARHGSHVWPGTLRLSARDFRSMGRFCATAIGIPNLVWRCGPASVEMAQKLAPQAH